MKRILVIIAVFCLVAVTGNAQKGKDWAQYGVYKSANEAVTEAPAVAFMGDSITENWLKFRKEFFSSRNFAARGISGQTTYQMLARFQRDVVDLKPKKVVILAGTNDIAENCGPISLDNVVGNIKSMCDIARANKIKPVVCSVIPCDRFVWRKDLKPAPVVKELNEKLKAFCQKEKIQYVDYHSALDNGEG